MMDGRSKKARGNQAYISPRVCVGQDPPYAVQSAVDEKGRDDCAGRFGDTRHIDILPLHSIRAILEYVTAISPPRPYLHTFPCPSVKSANMRSMYLLIPRQHPGLTTPPMTSISAPPKSCQQKISYRLSHRFKIVTTPSPLYEHHRQTCCCGERDDQPGDEKLG
jgi:hypothetical protein